MTRTEESVKLYWTKNPNCLIPHLDTIREIEAKKTAQGYVWDNNGKRHLFLPEDKDGICYPAHTADIERQEIAGINIVAIRNLYEKKLEAGKQVLQQMMDTVIKELDHVRYEEVNLIQLP